MVFFDGELESKWAKPETNIKDSHVIAKIWLQLNKSKNWDSGLDSSDDFAKQKALTIAKIFELKKYVWCKKSVNSLNNFAIWDAFWSV